MRAQAIAKPVIQAAVGAMGFVVGMALCLAISTYVPLQF
jgi:hypothetical protein